MWLKQNDAPICKGVLLQIGVCISIHIYYTPKFGNFQGVELKMLDSICNFFVICKSTLNENYQDKEIVQWKKRKP